MIEPKTDPNLFFFGNMIDLDCLLQDLRLVLKKTEEIDFDSRSESDNPLDDSGLILDIFPNIVRESYIVSLLIIFENELRGFCELLRVIEDIPIKWNQLRGSALERFLIYVESLSGLPLNADDEMKNKITGLIEARNCIVHANSRLENFGNRKAVEGFMRVVDGVKIDEGLLRFSYDACIECANIVSLFMEKAYNAALGRYPKKDNHIGE